MPVAGSTPTAVAAPARPAAPPAPAGPPGPAGPVVSVHRRPRTRVRAVSLSRQVAVAGPPGRPGELPPGHPPRQPGLDEHHHHRHADQRGDDRLERLRRQHEQQDRADQAAARRRRAEPDDPPPLALQFGAVAVHAAGHAGHQAHVVAHVREHRGIPEGEQRREGDQRAGADDGVDRARRQPGREDGEGLEEWHTITLRPPVGHVVTSEM